VKITQVDCAEFQRLCAEENGVALTLDEARDVLSRLCVFYEQFAGWVAAEKKTGASFED
jgi:hypothetical protein